MKSIKPGRGPSMQSFIGNIFVGIFGILWTIAAASMGAPGFFCLFGVVFVGLAIFQAVYNFKNATSKERYSSFDIVDEQEEADPWNRRFGRGGPAAAPGGSRFCPYCGAQAEADYAYCRQCGKRLPD